MTLPPALGALTVTLRRVEPSAAATRKLIAPVVKPAVSPPCRPVAKFDGPVDATRSLSPKKAEKPWPPLAADAPVIAPSACSAPPASTSRVLLVEEVSAPVIVAGVPVKSAIAWPPRAVFSAEVKLAASVKLPTTVPPTDTVLASKSITAAREGTPVASVTATVSWPVKWARAVSASRPVSRPVSAVGGGTALYRLCTAFSAVAVWPTSSESWPVSAGRLVSRSLARPPISPEPGDARALTTPLALTAVNTPAGPEPS